MKDRIFTSKDVEGNELTLKFVRPNQAILSKAELVFRSAFSKAFRADIITNAEVEKMLRERNIWNDEQRKEANDIRVQIIDLENKLEDDNASLSNEQGLALCNEITVLRIKLMSLNSIYQTIVDNTCETIAQEARNRFLCTQCIVDNTTGLRVYKDVDDFEQRSDDVLAFDAFRETVIASLEVSAGRQLPSDLTEDYAENKWKRNRSVGQPEPELLKETEEQEEVKVTRKPRTKKSS